MLDIRVVRKSSIGQMFFSLYSKFKVTVRSNKIPFCGFFNEVQPGCGAINISFVGSSNFKGTRRLERKTCFAFSFVLNLFVRLFVFLFTPHQRIFFRDTCLLRKSRTQVVAQKGNKNLELVLLNFPHFFTQAWAKFVSESQQQMELHQLQVVFTNPR